MSRIAVLLVLSSSLVACAATEGESSVSVGTLAAGEECPVTVPTGLGFMPSQPEGAVYTDRLPAPDPYPTRHPGEDFVWYGSDALWTAWPTGGTFNEKKTVFWSANFPGGTVEERPDLDVTWTRLDSKEPVVFDNHGVATNGYTPDVGWFMITGLEERLGAGCWHVEAVYKGATLSYVYEKG